MLIGRGFTFGTFERRNKAWSPIPGSSNIPMYGDLGDKAVAKVPFIELVCILLIG
jgi:hypothetical protein